MKVDKTDKFDIGEFTFLRETPEQEDKSVVLRIAKNRLHKQAFEKLKEAFGESVSVITATNVMYTSDPSDDVLGAIDALEDQGYDVIALDLVAPLNVKQEVVASGDIKAPILCQELERDLDGDPIVIGQDEQTRRDVLKVLRYSILGRGE